MKKSDMDKEYDFRKGKHGAVIPNQGKTRITIWIDTPTLYWFKDNAEREGRGYQTAINDALRNYTKREQKAIQDLIREAVRQELKALKKVV